MLKRIGAEESGEFKAVASGTVSSGKPVIVNSDGTVSVVSTTTLTEAAGSIVEFEAAATLDQGVAYDSANDRVVIAYRDDGNSSYGTAIVGTVSGDSISFGTPVVFESAYSDNFAPVFDSSNNKIVIPYRDLGDSNKGKAIVGTVSGTSISFGSITEFESGNTLSISTSFDTSVNKVVIAFQDGGDSNNGKAIVGTVSGTSISFGSVATFNAASTSHIDVAYDVANNKHVIAYKHNSGFAKVATVSGTDISFGSAAEFETGAIILTRVVNDPNINRVHIFYGDGGDSDKGKAVIGSVSGTSISFTGQSTFYGSAQVTEIGASFNTSINKVTISTRDNGGALNMFTSSVTTSAFTHGSAFAVDASITTGTVNNVHVPTAEKSVLVYTDTADSQHGKSLVYTGPGDVKNLTSENYIGMSPGNVTYDSATQAVGTEAVFKSGATSGFAAAFDSSTGKVVVAFSDSTDGSKGKAVVGTVDAANNSISFGSAVTFQNSEITGDQMDCIFDSNANKVVIFYTDTNNPSTDDRTGTAIVGTVSGTSISFGTKAAFESGNTQHINATFDSSNNKLVVAYRDADNSGYGTAAVGTISGTDISFGTPVVFESANMNSTAITFDSSNNKVVIAYKDQGNSDHGTSIVGTVSGTSISFGTAVVFEAAHTTHIETIFDSSNNKVVICYNDVGNSNNGTAIIGTVSGTSISYGSPVVFAAAETEYIRGVYDSNAGKILLLFKDGGNSNRPTIIIGTVSGTSISFGTEVVVMDVEGVSILPGVAFDSTNNKVVLAYIDTTGSDNAMAQVVQVAYDNTTRVNIADGNRASINIIGSVIDNQNSLTAGQQYFVQNDGTIGETADSPSVLAGTAISATELLVKT
jgi:hypothetical protein